MNLTQIRAFHVVAQERSFTKAAEVSDSMVAKLPAGEFTENAGRQGVYWWQRVNNWAKSNQSAGELLKRGLPKDPELLRQLHVDGAIVVTTPQDLSLLDAGRSLDLFGKAKVPVIGMVENMSYVACPRCGEQIEVFHRSEREWAVEDQAVPLLGRVPLDVAISRRITPEHPLVLAQDGSSVADGTAAAVFRDVAAKVAERLPAG